MRSLIFLGLTWNELALIAAMLLVSVSVILLLLAENAVYKADQILTQIRKELGKCRYGLS